MSEVPKSPRRYLGVKKNRGDWKPPPRRVLKELPPELYQAVLDLLVSEILTYTKHRDDLLNKYVGLARDKTIPAHRRANDVITALGLYLAEPMRFRYRKWKPELLEAYHGARKALGEKKDTRFNEAKASTV